MQVVLSSPEDCIRYCLCPATVRYTYLSMSSTPTRDAASACDFDNLYNFSIDLDHSCDEICRKQTNLQVCITIRYSIFS
jgi:hypothetical protein